jgi:hypothetical protein
MQKHTLRLMLVLSLSAPAAILCTTSALADNPSWAEQQARNAEMQRQALQQQQVQQVNNPRIGQYERWKQEWLQTHPGQPVPSMGVLEHMHEGQIIQQSNEGFAKMRAQRQAQLQAEYQMVKRNQEQQLAAQHITWTAQQWQAWDREYDQQHKQRAQEYLDAVKYAGEMEREEQRRRALGF